MPRPPKSVTQLSAETSHRSKEELEQRAAAEPRYFKQDFICPKGLSPLEQQLWEETTAIFKEMQNCPICDADSRAILAYVEWLARGEEAKAAWIKGGKKIFQLVEVGKDKNGNPKFERQKDNDYQVMLDSTRECDRLRKGLCLDLTSRAKVGATKPPKNEDDILDMLNNRSD